MARALHELRDSPLRRALGTRRVVVVLSDFCDANVGAWRRHPRLAELATAGVVDFAVFDAAAQTVDETPELRLLESKVLHSCEPVWRTFTAGTADQGVWRVQATLSPDTLHNPLVTMCNYVFDTLPHDAFQVRCHALWCHMYCK